MAQTIETSNYLTIKIPLTRDGEETTRSINLPVPKELIGDVQTAFDNLITYFSSGDGANTINWLFQPTNWRDEDDAEEAWQCADLTKITYELVETTRTSGGFGS